MCNVCNLFASVHVYVHVCVCTRMCVCARTCVCMCVCVYENFNITTLVLCDNRTNHDNRI